MCVKSVSVCECKSARTGSRMASMEVADAFTPRNPAVVRTPPPSKKRTLEVSPDAPEATEEIPRHGPARGAKPRRLEEPEVVQEGEREGLAAPEEAAEALGVAGSIAEVQAALSSIRACTSREQGSKISFNRADQVAVREACARIYDVCLNLMVELHKREEMCRALEGEKRVIREDRERANKPPPTTTGGEAGKQQTPPTEAPQQEETRKKRKRKRGQRKTTTTGATPPTTGEEVATRSQPRKQGYAEAVKKGRKPAWETLVEVQGRRGEEATRAVTDFLRKEADIGPMERIVPTRRGVVVLNCSSEEQQKHLEAALASGEGEVRIAREKADRNLPLTVMGLERRWRAEEVIAEVYRENESARAGMTMAEFTGAMRFLSRRRRGWGGDMVDIVFTVEPTLHQRLLELGRISVGRVWRKMEVKYDVVRCFRCSRFGHRSSVCNEKQCCANCGGEHALVECREQKPDCPNCRRSGAKERAHKASSPECPQYRRAVEQKKARFAVRKP